MKKNILGILAAVAMIAGAVALPTAVHAEEEPAKSTSVIEISPNGARLIITGNQVIEGDNSNCPQNNNSDGCAVKVTNNGEEAFRYRVYVTPYVVGQGNTLSFDDASSNSYTQLSRWITLKNSAGEYASEAQFTIQPGETQTIPYRVTVPQDIPGGSQYAVIWAQPIVDSNQAGINTVGQVGSVIKGSTLGETNESVEIKEMGFTRFAFNGPLDAKIVYKNDGNTDFLAKYSYTARTFFGKEIYTSGELTQASFPENEYTLEMSWDDVPFVGIFQVELNLLAAGESKTEKHVVVVMPIFIMVLLILLLTVIIVWIIIIIRKRKEHKARKLV